MSGRRDRAGFTLIEVLAVMLLTSLVLAVALNHYVDLSRASERAMDHARSVRRAATLLDRVARDLEQAVLVAKQPEQDPWTHPWLFFGESRYSQLGSVHLKFVTRGRVTRSTAVHESDLEVVAYALTPAESGHYELRRWSSPRLPEELDVEIPREESRGSVLLADDVVDFGVTFIDDLGARTPAWDSSQLVESSELPAAAEIALAMREPSGSEEAGLEPEVFRRLVLLPVRPLRLDVLLDPLALVNGGPGTTDEDEGEVEEEDEDGYLAACLETPCAKMTACQAINCEAHLGHHGPSIDMMLRDTIERNVSFCRWRLAQAPMFWFMIDNPACRKR